LGATCECLSQLSIQSVGGRFKPACANLFGKLRSQFGLLSGMCEKVGSGDGPSALGADPVVETTHDWTPDQNESHGTQSAYESTREATVRVAIAAGVRESVPLCREPRLPVALTAGSIGLDTPGHGKGRRSAMRRPRPGTIDTRRTEMPAGETGHPSLRDDVVADARGLKNTEWRRRLDAVNPYEHPAGVEPTLRTPFSEALDKVKVTDESGALDADKVRKASKK
jgi:hypothetical protein